jgi:hypothetical protein
MVRLTTCVALIGSLLTACVPCKDVACLNGAECDKGDCICLDGFSGTHCEIEDKCITNNVACANDRPCEDGVCDCGDWYVGSECEELYINQFVGSYAGYETCSNDVFYQNMIISVPGGDDPGHLMATNSQGLIVILEMEEGKTGAFTAASTANSNKVISGEGTLTSTNFYLNYVIYENGSPSITCAYQSVKMQ